MSFSVSYNSTPIPAREHSGMSDVFNVIGRMIVCGLQSVRIILLSSFSIFSSLCGCFICSDYLLFMGIEEQMISQSAICMFRDLQPRHNEIIS